MSDLDIPEYAAFIDAVESALYGLCLVTMPHITDAQVLAAVHDTTLVCLNTGFWGYDVATSDALATQFEADLHDNEATYLDFIRAARCRT